MLTANIELQKNLFESKWLFDLCPELVMVCSFDIGSGFGAFMEANEKTLNFFGYVRDEFIGRPVTGVLPDNGIPACVMQKLSEEKQVQFETVYLTRDGRTVPVETEACLLHCDGDDLVVFFSSEVSSRYFERTIRVRMLEKLVSFLGICSLSYEVNPRFGLAESAGNMDCVCRSMRLPCMFRVETKEENRKRAVLTGREREVLEWISKGKNTGDISALLDIKESTVRYHVNRILDKFNALTRAHAVAIAFQKGVL